jgi:hypothetical protein
LLSQLLTLYTISVIYLYLIASASGADAAPSGAGIAQPELR